MIIQTLKVDMGFLPQNFKNYSKSFYTFLISFGILISLGLYFNSTNLTILPANNYQSYIYTDEFDGGSSKGELNIEEESTTLSYSISKSIDYPYVGFSIEDTSRSKNFNISNYEILNLKVSAGKAVKIPIYIVVYMDGITDESNSNSYVRYAYELDYDKSINTFSIPLKSFVVPQWWYKMNGKKVGDFKRDFSQVNSINIESGKFAGNSEIDFIKVDEITFSKSVYWHWFIIAGLTLVLIVVLFKKYLKQSTVFISYKETEQTQSKTISKQDIINEEKILFFIAENYNNPELSLTGMQKDISISSTNISKIIKSKFGLSFKQYINQIRLNEAKRLLKGSELSISEIAYKVGYNNVSHFNRVFKQEFDISPSDYKVQ